MREHQTRPDINPLKKERNMLNLLRKMFDPNIPDWKDMTPLELMVWGVMAAGMITLPLIFIGGLLWRLV